MGLAVLHQPQLTIRQMVAEDPEHEIERFRQALEAMHTAIDDLLRVSSVEGGEHHDILETYRMFAEDRGWLSRIREAISNGLTAEAAVQRVQNDTRARMSQLHDPYLRERLLDLDDLANRLLQHLAGKELQAAASLPDDVILVARSMGPAELLDYDRRRLRALVLEEGSRDQPCRDRRPRARHPGGRAMHRRADPDRAGRPAYRRWRQRPGAGPPGRGYPGRFPQQHDDARTSASAFMPRSSTSRPSRWMAWRCRST